MTDLNPEEYEPDELTSEVSEEGDPEEYEPEESEAVSPETGTVYDRTGEPETTPEDEAVVQEAEES